jgi:3-oxoacyl-[acyl-carrier-protein] synthase II
MELTAVETLFGIRRFPVFSVKGSMGHTLGAAGGIETALSAWALKNKTVPPTVGLLEAEERAKGRVSAEAQSFGGEHILTTNSGFGGVNAALLLKRVEE